jgi:hypothetical protein
VRLVGQVRRDGSGDDPVEVYFGFPTEYGDFVSDRADAFVPTLLIPAMAAGEDLEIVPPVSAQLLEELPTLQHIFQRWYPDRLQKVEVRATARQGEVAHPPEQIGMFFSLGVDSFHTLLRPRPSERVPTYLIFLKGVEKPLDEYDRGQEVEVIDRIERVAAATGKTTIIGETNLRTLFPVAWGQLYHGAGLAGAAHALGNGLGTVLVPSTHTYQNLLPWGTSPITDPLWSTETTRIRHDGSETSRAEKVAQTLVHDEHAMAYLRVCTRNAGGVHNCGRCSKCIRTMLTLHLVGKLQDAPTLPDSLPHDYARSIRTGRGALALVEELLEIAERYDSDPRATRILRRKVRQSWGQLFFAKSRFDQAQREVFIWYLYTDPLRRLTAWYARPSSAWVRPWYRRARAIVRGVGRWVGRDADSR